MTELSAEERAPGGVMTVNNRVGLSIVLTLVLAAGAVAVVMFCERGPTWESVNYVRTFNIPPQPLRDALSQFSRQSRLALFIDDDAEQMHETANAVTGILPTVAALDRLLGRSGLVRKLVTSEEGDISIVVERAIEPGPVWDRITPERFP